MVHIFLIHHLLLLIIALPIIFYGMVVHVRCVLIGLEPLIIIIGVFLITNQLVLHDDVGMVEHIGIQIQSIQWNINNRL